MSDSQVLSIAIMVLAVLAGSLYNNVRISDMRDLIKANTEMLRAEIAKNHSELLHKFAELETRLSKLESR